MTSDRSDAADEWASRRHPVEEDMEFQRRSWRVQRFGWAVMVLLMILALAGLFSVGPLSTTTATSPDGRLAVESERFLRNGAATEVKLVVQTTGAETELRVGSSFLDSFAVNDVRPEPLRATSSTQQMSLVFASPPDRAPLVIFFKVRPDALGPIQTSFSTGDGASAVLDQLVYP